MYLQEFHFPSAFQEEMYVDGIRRTCYTSVYPFMTLTEKNLRQLDFEPVTILYGSNGSGKTTVLNCIAEKLGAERDTLYNRSNFYDDYLEYCEMECHGKRPCDIRIITSDDVFDYMMNIRKLNEGIDVKREELFDNYMDQKYADFKMNSLEDYDKLKQVNLARRTTQSEYIRRNLANNIREQSNGESAFMYFTEKIKENAIYLLDEPENSLSPNRQEELVRFIRTSAQSYNCQFIIATHSPFILAMNGAKIYDLDENPVDVKKWTELKNVRLMYDFFKGHESEFGSDY